eukprot:g255.t1
MMDVMASNQLDDPEDELGHFFEKGIHQPWLDHFLMKFSVRAGYAQWTTGRGARSSSSFDVDFQPVSGARFDGCEQEFNADFFVSEWHKKNKTQHFFPEEEGKRERTKASSPLPAHLLQKQMWKKVGGYGNSNWEVRALASDLSKEDVNRWAEFKFVQKGTSAEFYDSDYEFGLLDGTVARFHLHELFPLVNYNKSILREANGLIRPGEDIKEISPQLTYLKRRWKKVHYHCLLPHKYNFQVEVKTAMQVLDQAVEPWAHLSSWARTASPGGAGAQGGENIQNLMSDDAGAGLEDVEKRKASDVERTTTPAAAEAIGGDEGAPVANFTGSDHAPGASSAAKADESVRDVLQAKRERLVREFFGTTSSAQPAYPHDVDHAEPNLRLDDATQHAKLEQLLRLREIETLERVAATQQDLGPAFERRMFGRIRTLYDIQRMDAENVPKILHWAGENRKPWERLHPNARTEFDKLWWLEYSSMMRKSAAMVNTGNGATSLCNETAEKMRRSAPFAQRACLAFALAALLQSIFASATPPSLLAPEELPDLVLWQNSIANKINCVFSRLSPAPASTNDYHGHLHIGRKGCLEALLSTSHDAKIAAFFDQRLATHLWFEKGKELLFNPRKVGRPHSAQWKEARDLSKMTWAILKSLEDELTVVERMMGEIEKVGVGGGEEAAVNWEEIEFRLDWQRRYAAALVAHVERDNRIQSAKSLDAFLEGAFLVDLSSSTQTGNKPSCPDLGNRGGLLDPRFFSDDGSDAFFTGRAALGMFQEERDKAVDALEKKGRRVEAGSSRPAGGEEDKGVAFNEAGVQSSISASVEPVLEDAVSYQYSAIPARKKADKTQVVYVVNTTMFQKLHNDSVGDDSLSLLACPAAAAARASAAGGDSTAPLSSSEAAGTLEVLDGKQTAAGCNEQNTTTGASSLSASSSSSGASDGSFTRSRLRTAAAESVAGFFLKGLWLSNFVLEKNWVEFNPENAAALYSPLGMLHKGLAQLLAEKELKVEVNGTTAMEAPAMKNKMPGLDEACLSPEFYSHKHMVERAKKLYEAEGAVDEEYLRWTAKQVVEGMLVARGRGTKVKAGKGANTRGAALADLLLHAPVLGGGRSGELGVERQEATAQMNLIGESAVAASEEL